MTGDVQGTRGRAVLVVATGAAVGRLTAVELAARGHRVWAAVRHADEAEQLGANASAAGVNVEMLDVNIRSEASVIAAVRHVVAAAERIDVVANCAGIAALGPLEFANDDEIGDLIEINVLAPIRVIRAALPWMRRQRQGRIVNVSTPCAQTRSGMRLFSVFAASNAALHTLTLDLNKEVVPLGIRAVLVEGGVSAAARMDDAAIERARTLGDDRSPYRLAGGVAAAQVQAMTSVAVDHARIATMIADACVVDDPPLRFPPEAQRALDRVKRLNDRDFLKLCAFDEVDTVLERNGLSQTPWRITE